MKIILDTNSKQLTVQDDAGEKHWPLYSTQAFEIISAQWLKVGWNQKYPYTFSWLGRPIIQNPEDLLRIQEVIYRVRPDVIIETGIAHGGSLIFYASLCRAMGHGRVIGVDVEIRPQNRQAIETHELFPLVTLIEGNSTAPEIVKRVESLVETGESTLVILDSCHTKSHVSAELEAYQSLVTPHSYLIATDGIMRDLYDVPRGHENWIEDHPAVAAEEFAQRHSEFVLEQPAWTFNESELSQNVTHWPSAWLRRREMESSF